MIDFRYHIISLVAVFLALAVGIILGAGPLQNSIGDTLSGEVGSLREANSELKSVNEKLSKERGHYVSAFDQVAPSLLQGTLTNQSLAIVTFPGTNEEDLKKVQERITLSGATVSGVYEIQKAWTDSKATAYRSSFAEQIKAYVPDAKNESDANKVMALALNQIISGGTQTAENKTVSELMTGADTVMLKIASESTSASSAAVFLSPDMPDLKLKKDEKQDPDKIAQSDYDAKTFAALVKIFSDKMPTVIGGYANSQHDLVLQVRTSGIKASSVDALNSAVGATNVVLALAAELKEQKVSYGFADGVDSVIGKRIEAPATPPANG